MTFDLDHGSILFNIETQFFIESSVLIAIQSFLAVVVGDSKTEESAAIQWPCSSLEEEQAEYAAECQSNA